MFIYVIVCSETLKLYVGQHKGEDLGKYLSKKYHDAFRYTRGMSHLYAAMRKHSRATWSIRALVEVDTKAECDYWERHFIRTLKTQHPDVGYNICDGGEGRNGPMSPAQKVQLSARMKAQWAAGWTGMKGKMHDYYWKQQASIRAKAYKPTAATNQKIADSLRGHKVSPETRQKQSEAKKGRYDGTANPFFGKHHSEESKRKSAESHKGKNVGHPSYVTPAGIEKMRAALKGKPWSAERRAAWEQSRLLTP